MTFNISSISFLIDLAKPEKLPGFYNGSCSGLLQTDIPSHICNKKCFMTLYECRVCYL